VAVEFVVHTVGGLTLTELLVQPEPPPQHPPVITSLAVGWFGVW
jgi:hypothetical protein